MCLWPLCLCVVYVWNVYRVWGVGVCMCGVCMGYGVCMCGTCMGVCHVSMSPPGPHSPSCPSPWYGEPPMPFFRGNFWAQRVTPAWRRSCVHRPRGCCHHSAAYKRTRGAEALPEGKLEPQGLVCGLKPFHFHLVTERPLQSQRSGRAGFPGLPDSCWRRQWVPRTCSSVKPGSLCMVQVRLHVIFFFFFLVTHSKLLQVPILLSRAL